MQCGLRIIIDFNNFMIDIVATDGMYLLIFSNIIKLFHKICRILTCNLNKQCGFGCQLHHVTYCFIVAYGLNRTLVLTDDGRTWNYAKDGWTAAFLPITKCSFSEIFQVTAIFLIVIIHPFSIISVFCFSFFPFCFSSCIIIITIC